MISVIPCYTAKTSFVLKTLQLELLKDFLLIVPLDNQFVSVWLNVKRVPKLQRMTDVYTEERGIGLVLRIPALDES